MRKNNTFLFEKSKFGIEEIAKANYIDFVGLFGSYARGEETDDSDIDLFVKFDFSKKSVGLFELYRIQKQLEQLLGKKVDLVTKPNKLIMPFIEEDLLTIYERR
ncbi:hypothetical protein GW793_01280 [bacterium]|nr:hypothetical protein [bacterium]